MLRPPQAQVADVAYWVNKELERRGQAAQLACVNTAVEESTLADRAGARMLAQVCMRARLVRVRVGVRVRVRVRT